MYSLTAATMSCTPGEWGLPIEQFFTEARAIVASAKHPVCPYPLNLGGDISPSKFKGRLVGGQNRDDLAV